MKNAFQDWVDDMGGLMELAYRMDVAYTTTRVWYRREGYPKVETMEKIVKLSKGRLTLESLIESIRPLNSKTRKG